VAAADYAAAQGGWGRYARYHHSRLYVVDQVLRGCPGGDLLDVGCGPGILVRHLLDTRNGDFRITACDRSQAMIDAVAQRVADADGVRLTVGRIENMPYSDGSFDIALVLGVLEYTDCASGVREIARVVRPGGMVVVTMLNPASPYRLFEWFVYWPARRVLAAVEGLLRMPPERRHGGPSFGDPRGPQGTADPDHAAGRAPAAGCHWLRRDMAGATVGHACSAVVPTVA